MGRHVRRNEPNTNIGCDKPLRNRRQRQGAGWNEREDNGESDEEPSLHAGDGKREAEDPKGYAKLNEAFSS
jgi:hypothetical protein